MKTQILIIGLAALLLAGCASNGIAPMGDNTYMIHRGGWPRMDGFAVESECYRDANQFCINKGLIMVPVSTATIDGQVFAHNASSELIFRAVTSTNDLAYKAYQNGKINVADHRVPLTKELSLETAYQNGNLSAAEYFQLKSQRDAQSQAYLQQLQAAQRQQQQDIQNSYRQTQAELDKNTANMQQFLINNTPVIQQHQSTAFPSFQPNQKLPSVMDMPSTLDAQTGKSQLGPDGRLWYEYRSATGYTYWRPAQ
jgi:hypothetical protein